MWFYKLYFWLYVIGTPLDTIKIIQDEDFRSDILSDPQTMVLFLGSIVMPVFASIGLYLYAYNKHWMPLIFWKISSIIYFCLSIIFVLRFSESFFDSSITLLFLIPVYLAFFRYSFPKIPTEKQKSE